MNIKKLETRNVKIQKQRPRIENYCIAHFKVVLEKLVHELSKRPTTGEIVIFRGHLDLKYHPSPHTQ